jgi:hypothetical protein
MACVYGVLLRAEWSCMELYGVRVTIAVHHSPCPYRELAPASWGLFLPIVLRRTAVLTLGGTE